MTIVAVAGGGATFGKTVVEQLLHAGKHKVVILSRSPPKHPQPVDVIVLDYDNVNSMKEMLEKHNVHTIVSVIGIVSDEASRNQINLIQAAGLSSATKRFIPGEYGPLITTKLLGIFPELQLLEDNADALAKTSLQYTRFIMGYFMDYWGMPHIQSDLRPYTWAVDMANCKAAIPGTGDDLITLTYSVDVARAIAMMIDVESWPEYTILSGSDITHNQLVQAGERVRGKPFDVVYDSVERLDAQEPSLLAKRYAGGSTDDIDGFKYMVSIFGKLTINGMFQVPVDNRLNDWLPRWKPMSIEDMLMTSWGEDGRSR